MMGLLARRAGLRSSSRRVARVLWLVQNSGLRNWRVVVGVVAGPVVLCSESFRIFLKISALLPFLFFVFRWTWKSKHIPFINSIFPLQKDSTATSTTVIAIT